MDELPSRKMYPENALGHKMSIVNASDMASIRSGNPVTYVYGMLAGVKSIMLTGTPTLQSRLHNRWAYCSPSRADFAPVLVTSPLLKMVIVTWFMWTMNCRGLFKLNVNPGSRCSMPAYLISKLDNENFTTRFVPINSGNGGTPIPGWDFLSHDASRGPSEHP